jgi:hypothetical protein
MYLKLTLALMKHHCVSCHNNNIRDIRHSYTASTTTKLPLKYSRYFQALLGELTSPYNPINNYCAVCYLNDSVDQTALAIVFYFECVLYTRLGG